MVIFSAHQKIINQRFETFGSSKSETNKRLTRTHQITHRISENAKIIHRCWKEKMRGWRNWKHVTCYQMTLCTEIEQQSSILLHELQQESNFTQARPNWKVQISNQRSSILASLAMTYTTLTDQPAIEVYPGPKERPGPRRILQNERLKPPQTLSFWWWKKK